MPNPYMHMPADTFDPSGVDGKGHNRLSIISMAPSVHCKLKPLTWQAAFESTSPTRHPSLWRQSWNSFGLCDHGSCDTCPLAKRVESNERNRLDAPAVVRIDDCARPWLMNKQKRGWGEYGLWFKDWSTFLQRWDVCVMGVGSDEHGEFIRVESK